MALAVALPASAQDAGPAAGAAQTAPAGVPEWGIASSELAADPAVRFGRLGNGMRYAVIYNANRDHIRNPDLIYPGQVFVLPTQ